MRYLERRMLHALLLLAGSSILCFLFSALAPGDFFDEIRLNPQIAPQTVTALRAQYGIDEPLPLKYGRWVRSVVRGDWGYSFAYNCPVRNLVVVRAGHTLVLTGIATTLAWLIAVPVGVWAAHRHGRWDDQAGLAVTSLLLSTPEIVLALLFLYCVVRTHLLPVGGMISANFDDISRTGKLVDLARHLVIPATTLALASLPVLVRHVRASMIEVLQASFIRSARACGISQTRLLFRYALPAAANPLASLFGLSVAGLLSGSLVVEVITGWPGLGPLLLEASTGRDIYVVVGAVMASSIFMIGGSFVGDVLLVVLDPRTRTR